MTTRNRGRGRPVGGGSGTGDGDSASAIFIRTDAQTRGMLEEMHVSTGIPKTQLVKRMLEFVLPREPLWNLMLGLGRPEDRIHKARAMLEDLARGEGVATQTAGGLTGKMPAVKRRR